MTSWEQQREHVTRDICNTLYLTPAVLITKAKKENALSYVFYIVSSKEVYPFIWRETGLGTELKEKFIICFFT